MEIPKIEESFQRADYYPSVTERYYRFFYYKSNESETTDHCILVHSNKICVITLGPKHPILKEKKTVKRLDFHISDNVDRLENKVIGKTKKGAQYIKPDSVLCYIECEDGSRYNIYGCIHGKLIEVNTALLQNCNLMLEKPRSDGYIAIILPTKKDFDPIKQVRLSMES